MNTLPIISLLSLFAAALLWVGVRLDEWYIWALLVIVTILIVVTIGVSLYTMPRKGK
jgi:uncharacterized membrane protein YoaT (DUF817 family)